METIMSLLTSKIKLFFLTLIVLINAGTVYAEPVIANNQGYIAVNGGKIFFTSFGSNTTKNPIIVLHGGPGALDHTYLLPQMLDLATDRQVTFYDQRGSGKSLGFNLDPQTINITNFVQDLEALRKNLGYEQFTLLGHSWGGVLALNYAISYPQNISTLVLLASAPHNTQGFQIFLKEYDKRLAPLTPEITKITNSTDFKKLEPAALSAYYRLIFSKYFYNPDDVAKLSLSFNAESYKSGMSVTQILQKNYLAKFDLSNDLPKLKVPVLMIHGANDIVPLATAKATNDLLPDSKLVILQECDHFPYIEQSTEFLANVRSLK
jgi:proline iminopeptidase